jgi:two-component system chemotaxis response regulator CheB
MAKIRVLVVDDSITVRKRLIEILTGDENLEVVGEAADGRQAIELCERLRPDVVTLDLVMPVLNGLEVTEHLMAYCPTPILIVSASTNREELFDTYEALAAGALDVLDKPPGAENGEWEQQFIATVKRASRIKVIRHPRAKLSRLRHPVNAPSSPAEPVVAPAGHSTVPYELVVIGASTGGPSAILEILKGLPPNFSLPILFVLHIGESFAGTFAEWLDGVSPIPVRPARDGEPLPKPGSASVLVAPAEQHLEIRNGRLRLVHGPERHACRPSIDVLFESVARDVGPRAVAVLLTGMGKDGASGLKDIRDAGGMTVAQDEASCVVFGMPREAIRLGAASHVLPLGDIAPFLRSLARRT